MTVVFKLWISGKITHVSENIVFWYTWNEKDINSQNQVLVAMLAMVKMSQELCKQWFFKGPVFIATFAA